MVGTIHIVRHTQLNQGLLVPLLSHHHWLQSKTLILQWSLFVPQVCKLTFFANLLNFLVCPCQLVPLLANVSKEALEGGEQTSVLKVREAEWIGQVAPLSDHNLVTYIVPDISPKGTNIMLLDSWKLSEHYKLKHGWKSKGQPTLYRAFHKGQGLMTGH